MGRELDHGSLRADGGVAAVILPGRRDRGWVVSGAAPELRDYQREAVEAVEAALLEVRGVMNVVPPVVARPWTLQS